MNRLSKIVLALVLLAAAFPALHHIGAALLAMVGTVLIAALVLAGHHTAICLTTTAVVLLCRAHPHHSHRLITWLAGAWLARIVLHHTPATA